MKPCGYECTEYVDTDEQYLFCSLPEGHQPEDDHRAVIEWHTRPIDICERVGHEWGEWEPIPEIPPKGATVESGFLALDDALFPHPPGHYTTRPTKRRECARCRTTENDGVWERAAVSNIYHTYMSDRVFPKLEHP